MAKCVNNVFLAAFFRPFKLVLEIVTLIYEVFFFILLLYYLEKMQFTKKQ